jgi:hypothetical protein
MRRGRRTAVALLTIASLMVGAGAATATTDLLALEDLPGLGELKAVVTESPAAERASEGQGDRAPQPPTQEVAPAAVLEPVPARYVHGDHGPGVRELQIGRAHV